MNGYERMVAAYKGQPTDKIPVMLHNFMMAAHECGITMGQYREDPKLIARTFIHTVEKYGVDAVLVDLDTVTLAGALGVPVDFPPHEPARSPGGCLASFEDMAGLKPINLLNYKYIEIWLESVRLLREHFGNEVMVRGNCDQAPFSLAGMMRGMDNWMTDFYLAEPQQITELLDYCCQATTQFVKLMAEAGAHSVSNGDSPAGPDLTPPELYAQYAFPYEKRVVEAAHSAGVFYTLHVCGNTDLILEKMIETGADAVEIDYKTDTKKAFEITRDRVTFTGNIDPSGVLALGTADMVRQKTLELLDIFSKTNKFILNSGCAIPTNTPEINIRTMIETARNYK